MTQELVLATHNQHKVAELSRVIAEFGLPISVLDLSVVEDVAPIAETGVTFAANAALKAHAIARVTGLPSIADDSGLCVDVMGGAPGIFSARWCGRHGDDAANRSLLLAQLHDVLDADRSAHFACAVVLALPDGTEHVAEGRMHGRIIREELGENGFGYDSIFVADGHRRTNAQLESSEKDAISHRGRALREIAPVLGKLLS